MAKCDILYQRIQYQVTSNMNILEPKLTLLRDIAREFASSLTSAAAVRNQCEKFLNRLEFELTARLNEKPRFTTKLGVALRELVLEDYRGLVAKAHSEYCRREEMFLRISEHCESLQTTINETEFSIQELKKIRKWSFDEYSYNQLACNRSIIEQLTFNKENLHLQPFRSSKGNEWSLPFNLSERKERKDWMKVKLSSKERREELINMQKKVEEAEIAEINAIIDECLENLAHFCFLNGSKKFKEIKLSESFSRHSQPEAQNNYSHGVSLGLESLNGQEINLLCNELIEDFNASRGSGLQRITEREEEHMESEASPTPQKRLTESTD